jgi:hypothetical protein
MPSSSRRPARLSPAIGVIVALGVAALAACGEETAPDDGQALADVLYESGAVDEGLESLLAATPKDDETRAARFLWPSNGEVLSSDTTPLQIWWDLGTMAMMREPASLPSPFVRDVAPASLRRAPSFGERALGLLLGGIEEAHAHGTPMSGSGFFLTFATPSNPKLLRVFTKNLGYEPDDAKRTLLTSQTEEITIELVTAEFDQNRIAQDGGPFRTKPITIGFRQPQQ